MAFDDVRLPEDIERGATGGPRFLTTIQSLVSGREQRNQEWVYPRHEYDISYGVQTSTDVDSSVRQVRDFYYARRGRLRSFRFKDFADFRVTNTATSPATGDGLNRNFTILRLYGDLALPFTRIITKPVASTIQVFIDDVEINTSRYNFDLTDQRLEFVSGQQPLSGEEVKVTCEFDVPVRFESDLLGIQLERCDVESIPSIRLVEVLGE